MDNPKNSQSSRRRLGPRRLEGAAVALAAVLAMVAAPPAFAGRWVSGGTFDLQRNVGVSFLRFLAEPDEGQMTIRCDPQAGLWIDAGVAGNGVLPAGVLPGGKLAAGFVFVVGTELMSATANGIAVLRRDGAVLVSISGADVAPLGRLLLVAAERVDITIDGVTRPVTLAGLLPDLETLATRCGAWPR